MGESATLMLDRTAAWIAWHLPRSVVKDAIVRAFAQASVRYGDKAMGEITCLDAWVAAS